MLPQEAYNGKRPMTIIYCTGLKVTAAAYRLTKDNLTTLCYDANFGRLMQSGVWAYKSFSTRFSIVERSFISFLSKHREQMRTHLSISCYRAHSTSGEQP